MGQTPPVIPGWDVIIDPDDASAHLVAVRRADLTKYQRIYGAMAEMTARDEGELLLLCDAQTRLAERLATAEAAVRPRNLKPG